MTKPLFLNTLLLLSMGLFAQTDTTIFNAIHKEETAEYILSVPTKWKFIPYLDAASKDRKYDFTGIALPTEFNHTPVVATFTLRKYVCNQRKEAEDHVLGEFTTYPDRITPAGHNYDVDSMAIASGEMAIIFSTHYYRRTKASNYTRYDMVVYSQKRKAAYMLTAIVQYRDFNYTLETTTGLKKYMYRIFKDLLLR